MRLLLGQKAHHRHPALSPACPAPNMCAPLALPRPTPAGNHPRYHSALSDVSTVVGGPTPRGEPPTVLMHSLSAGGSAAPTVTTLPRSYTAPTRPSVEPASVTGEWGQGAHTWQACCEVCSCAQRRWLCCELHTTLGTCVLSSNPCKGPQRTATPFSCLQAQRLTT